MASKSSKSELDLAKRIGRRIREIRKQKKITLIELSETTDVAQATLSRMETGQMLGTVESHRRIAEALGVSLSHLYQGIDQRQETVKLQSGSEKRQVVQKNDSSRSEMLIQNVTSKKFVPLLITLNANGKTSKDRCERGIEKLIWVVEGEVKVVFENNEYALKTNDTLYFDGSTSHQLVNKNPRQAKVLSVSSK